MWSRRSSSSSSATATWPTRASRRRSLASIWRCCSFPIRARLIRLASRHAAPPVPARAEVEAALAKRNPELQSALASSHLADLNVICRASAYLPDLALNYTYGIDAAQFAAQRLRRRTQPRLLRQRDTRHSRVGLVHHP